MAIFKSHTKPGQLKHSIFYADKDRRTEHNPILTVGINCSKYANIAILEMTKIKNIFNKVGGRECQHYILSFAKDEINLTTAVEYVERHAAKCFGDKFQVFVGIHINSDSKCIHAHYIVNSVSFVDGSKIQTSKEDYNRFRDYNDELAKEYGLKIIDRSPKAVKARKRPQLYSMKEYQLQKKVATNKKFYGYSYVNNCFNAIQSSLEKQPKNLVRFINAVKQQGWLSRFRGKQLVFVNIHNSKQRVRANTLAKKYNLPDISTAAILRRCNERSWQNYLIPVYESGMEKSQIKNTLSTNRSITSIFASLSHIHSERSDADNQRRSNKMKIKLHNEDYENESYGR